MPKPNEKKNNNRAAIKIVKMLVGTAVGIVLFCTAMNVLNAFSERGNVQPPQTQPPFKFQISWLYTPPKSTGWLVTILVGYFFGLLVSFKSEQKYQAQHSQDDLHGSSRWATNKELKQNLYIIDEKKPYKAKKSGTPLAYIDGKYYCDTSTTHSLIVGVTRSGKTQTFVLPFITLLAESCKWKNKQSMIINDPKGEILTDTYQILKDNGYNIVVLNLKDTTRTSRWNPCTFICDEYVYAKEHGTDMSKVNDFVGALCAAITYDPTSKEKIWQDSARSLMEALLLHMLDVAYDNNCMDKVSIAALAQFMIEYGKKKVPKGTEMVNLLTEIFDNLPQGSTAKGAYSIASFAGDGDTRAGVDFSLANKINLFQKDEGVVNLTAKSDIIFEDIVKEPTAVFMIVPDDRKTRHPIASLFVNQCYTSLCNYIERKHIKSLSRRVNFILDEFCNMVGIDDMDTKITITAGKNILFHLVIQDFTQLKNHYEKAADTIKSNCGNTVYIYAKDLATKKEFSEMLGSKTVPYTAYSGSSKEVISGQNYNAMEMPLMRPDELQVLQAGETIVSRLRMYPIFSKFPFFYEKHKYKGDAVIDASLDNICPRTEEIDLHHTFDLDLLDTTRTPKRVVEDDEPAPMQPVQHSEEHKQGGSDAEARIRKILDRKFASKMQEQPPRYKPVTSPPPTAEVEEQSFDTRQQPVVTIKEAMERINRMTGNEFADALSEQRYEECMQLIRRSTMKNNSSLPKEYAETLTEYVMRFTRKDINL